MSAGTLKVPAQVRAIARERGCEWPACFVTHGKQASRVKLWHLRGDAPGLVRALKRRGLDAYLITSDCWYGPATSVAVRFNSRVRISATAAQKAAAVRRARETRAMRAAGQELKASLAHVTAAFGTLANMPRARVTWQEREALNTLHKLSDRATKRKRPS